MDPINIATTVKLLGAAPDGESRERAKVRVTLAELDSGMGYLSYLVAEVNRAQDYFHFDLVYLPTPSGTLLSNDDPDRGPPRLFLPRIDDYLRPLPGQLGVDLVCILTRCMIGGFTKEGYLFGDYLAAALTNEPRVFAVSTYGMRGYARQAGVPFLKAVLFLCVGMILVADTPLDFHDETVGCPLDRCVESRDKIVVGLQHMKFDHRPCREQIEPWDGGEMVKAIDALLTLPLSAPSGETARPAPGAEEPNRSRDSDAEATRPKAGAPRAGGSVLTFRLPYLREAERRRALLDRARAVTESYGMLRGTTEEGTFRGQTPISDFAGLYRSPEGSDVVEISLTKKPWLIPKSFIESALQRFFSETLAMNTGGSVADRTQTATAATGTATRDAASVATAGEADRTQVKEERLRAEKRPVEAGEVTVRKEVHTETKHLDAPVQKEEVVIERTPVGGRATTGGIAGVIREGEEVRIPVREEKMDVSKEAVVTEEVKVGKRVVQDTECVAGKVRKEEVKVEQKGNVNVHTRGTGKGTK